MHLGRPVIALNPRLFGRGPARDVGAPDEPAPALSDDLKLFAATFVAGFVFVSILIG
jgi:hypothetical protein